MTESKGATDLYHFLARNTELNVTVSSQALGRITNDAFNAGLRVPAITHPEAQGNKDLGEPGASALEVKGLREILAEELAKTSLRDADEVRTGNETWRLTVALDAMRVARDAALIEAAEIVCGGCARGWRIEFGRHQTTPGSSMPCAAYRIRELLQGASAPAPTNPQPIKGEREALGSESLK